MNILHKRWTSKCQPSVYRLKQMIIIPVANARNNPGTYKRQCNANLFLISNYTDKKNTPPQLKNKNIKYIFFYITHVHYF